MSLTRTLPIAAILLLILPAAAGAQDSADDADDADSEVVVEAPRQVTGNANPTRLFSIPALAVHPDEPSTVVMAVGDSRNGGCGLHVSRDAGASWAQTADHLLPEDLPFCHQRPLFPVMAPAFGSDGTLHVGLPGSRTDEGHPNGPIGMYAARTDDLGASHDVATIVEGGRVTADPGDYGQEGEADEAFTWHKAPSIAVDPNDPDNVFLAMRWNVWGTDLQWFDGDVPFRPYFAASNDGGETWNEAIDIVENAEGEDIYGTLHHDLVASPDGTLYSFTREWPAPTGEDEPSPDRRLLMLTSSDGGQSWEITPILDGVVNTRAPVAAVDPQDGTLYVVYGNAADTDDDEPAPQELFFTSSDDGGETWSDPAQITDETDAPDTAADSQEPGIAVAPNGRIDVAWYDFRNDPFFQPGDSGPMGGSEEARYWDVYHTHSADGGDSWSPNTRVTETFVDSEEGATFNNMDVRGPVGVASADRAAYIAWSDSRATTAEGDAEDAYFSALRFPSDGQAGGRHLTSAEGGVGSPWLWGLLGAGTALALGGLLLLLGIRRARPQPSPAAQT